MQKYPKDFIALLVLVSNIICKAGIERLGVLYPYDRVLLKLQ